MNPEALCLLRTFAFLCSDRANDWRPEPTTEDMRSLGFREGMNSAYTNVSRDLHELLIELAKQPPPPAETLLQHAARAGRQVLRDIVHVYGWARFAMVLG